MTQEHPIRTIPRPGPDDGREPTEVTGAFPVRPAGGAWRRHWRALPRGAGYLALTAVLVGLVGGFSFTVAALLGNGTSSLPAFALAAAVLVGALWAARWFGHVELVRLHWATGHRARPVDWSPRTAPGSGGALRAVSVLANPHYWLYLLFTVVVFPVVGAVSTSLVGAAVLWSLLGATFGIARLASSGPVWGQWAATAGDRLGWGLLSLGGALALVVLLPSLVHLLVLLHERIGHALLGGFRSEQLAAEVAGLEVSRSAAVSAEGTALRRLERDIHDGPQQRLVRLQMDLGAASRAVEADPERARGLIAEALQLSRDALEELRALSRGFAPPLLADRGLSAALSSLAATAPVPTTFRSALPEGAVLPAELERNAYFIAAELVTNVAKHAAAGEAWLSIGTRPARDGRGTLLDVVVEDDGRGGAGLRDGHGLAGVQERLVGLGGSLDITSPQGGPTVVTVSIPVPLGARAAAQEA
ncbi:sensor histidine kinase [Frigoribacterium salinisoli]